MENRKYKIKYLPEAYDSIIKTITYIKEIIGNVKAANSLIDEFDKAIKSLELEPYVNPLYLSIKSLKQEYRKLIIKNYILFYWIDEKNKVITISDFVYAKSNYRNKIR